MPYNFKFFVMSEAVHCDEGVLAGGSGGEDDASMDQNEETEQKKPRKSKTKVRQTSAFLFRPNF